jgi:tetratricopeptide (TPR) repeat protein
MVDHFQLAEAFFRQGEYVKACEEYEQAIKPNPDNPDNADAYFKWGIALGSLEQYEEAIAKYQKATELDPDYAYAYHNIADISWQQGAYRLGREKWEITTAAYNRVKEAEKQNNNADHFLHYGTVLSTLNDLDRAEETYQEGLAIDPANLDILTELVNFYVKKAAQDINKKSPINWSKARQYYTKARKLLTNKINKLDDTTTALNLGKLYLVMEEYEEAENYLLQALKKDSDSIEVLNSLGTLFIEKEDFKKSTEYFKKSIKIDPDSLDVRSNLGQSYLKLQQLTDAEREYRKILSITSYHVESHIGLGEVYIEMAEQGDSDIYLQAIRHFTKAIEISKNNEGSKQLSKKELSEVQYLRGYARIKLHESSTVIRNENLITDALDDFKNCIKSDPENYKGSRAVEKLQKQANILRTQTLSQWIGTLFILIPSLFILGMTQWTYWKPFFSQDNNLLSSQSVVKLQKKGTPNNNPTAKNNTQTQTKSVLQKTSQPSNKLNTTEYFLLTFGSLTFSLISLYLPQLLKLKISGTGIELEKSSIDQITTTQITTSLGIKK